MVTHRFALLSTRKSNYFLSTTGFYMVWLWFPCSCFARSPRDTCPPHSSDTTVFKDAHNWMLRTEAAKISHLSLFPVSFLPLGQDTSTHLSRVINRTEQAFMREAHGKSSWKVCGILQSARAPESHMWFISSRVPCSVTAHYKSNILMLQKWPSSQALKPVLNYSSLRQWQDPYAIIFGGSLKLRVGVLCSYSVAKQGLTHSLPMRNIKPFHKQYQHILLCHIWV